MIDYRGLYQKGICSTEVKDPDNHSVGFETAFICVMENDVGAEWRGRRAEKDGRYV
jgi:hypothetical protein